MVIGSSKAIKIIDFTTKKEIRVLKHVPLDNGEEEIPEPAEGEEGEAPPPVKKLGPHEGA